MKHLVQILLPVTRQPESARVFEALAKELTARFGGVTSFVRTPAEGRWKSGATTERDDIAVVEVMCDELDAPYWRDLRGRLERDLGQEELVVRCHPLTLL